MPGLFRADTALTGGVGAGGFDLFYGTAFPVLFYLLAGKFTALLYGEIGVLLDDRIGCVGHCSAGVLGGGVVAIPLRGYAFSQLGSTFLLGFCPRLFQYRFGDFSGRIAFRHPPGGLFFNIFHGITPVIDYSNKISKSFKKLFKFCT